MIFRKATINDLPAIVRMLADDELGATREQYRDPLPQVYIDAFERMERQEGNQIIVAVEGEDVMGCLQLTYIPGVVRLGMLRAQIEGVRVDRNHRSKGVGEALFKYAIQLAEDAGCGLVQLTTDKARTDAHRFYERLGFVISHEGMKLYL
ncbi:GNAT family N-acetyltransferase [Paenibacillus sp. N1-5-1-14]|uniref:GNAT family N-acetyltransferase n=1 Tax=Paenibacillus radicibacter TaxID=2972488 RepID=UPI00215900AD|nr:GNAT family N-acetyltransferase [Paenibacillus radicibacter]MCR8644452.1 GNAT family N-acetyltransferase [Paenibacillus radicibacter]